ncbi:hypothetical protein ELUMI_v1c08350 [Williamsoniiplasma luminosum]|uniref:ABC3 transporter permease C-terminal domain-containing protein n=1 Tax=Williamsoniiplasma luminosum TaxID=214888 RepID=A0A2K8NVI4_9MOLU|nr:ABC transporter permease [Williamsoniiplasma luminosum]ATZ17556.1 hypothetical protein ELUMI_v1c08350 [Williamsoniiplasma luminosum]
MLLFKNGLKRLLKDYLQFFIYLILITITVVLTSTLGIVSVNLKNINNQINRNYEKHDYSFRYTSSGYPSNDTQTFTPWFSFNTELVGNEKLGFFPTLTFGDEKDSALLKYKFVTGPVNSYKSSIFEYGDKKYFNFHFGDTESDTTKDKPFAPKDDGRVLKFSEAKKIDVVKSGKFGDFYKFNFGSKYFKNSLIGQLYAKNNGFEGSLNPQQTKSALDIFDYMFALNNSSLTYSIKQELVKVYEKNIGNNPSQAVEDYINNPKNDKETVGRIGQIIKATDSDGKDIEKYEFVEDVNLYKEIFDPISDASEYNLYKNYASFNIKKHDATTILKTGLYVNGYHINDNPLTQRKWFESYFNLLSDLSNFKIRTTNEAVMWDANGHKFRYISSFYNHKLEDSDKFNVTFYNEDLYSFFKKNDSPDLFTENSFMVSNGYAEFNKLKLGQVYNIFPGSMGSNAQYRLDATGADSLNIYPIIYEDDILTNQENEAIYYISSSTFSKMFNGGVDPGKFQDVSRAYLIHNSGSPHDLINDKKVFSTYLADNVMKLKEVATALNNHQLNDELTTTKIQEYAKTPLLNFRSTLFPSTLQKFVLISIIFTVIFIAALCFVIYTIFKKVINTERGQIGNLKALGVSNFKILVNYISYMLIPVIFVTLIGWGISLALQPIFMTTFERYFNIPSVFNIDWKVLLIELFALAVIVIGMVFMTTYFVIKQSPIILLSPAKSMRPNLFLKKVFSKIPVVRFNSKLKLVILASSWKDLLVFFSVLFIASLVIFFAASIPSILNSMTNEFYRNIHYNNNYSYINTLSNNPLTRYSFYAHENDPKNSNLEASIFNVYIPKKEKANEYVGFVDQKDLEYWKKDNGEEYRNVFESILFKNFLTFKGGLISVGVMDQVLDYASKINEESRSIVEKKFNQLTSKIFPMLLGQKPIDDEKKGYEENIKYMSNNLLPSATKELWDKDPKEIKNFSFNFSSIPVNPNEDELFTKIEGTIDNADDTKIIGFGVNTEHPNPKLQLNNRSIIAHNETLDYIPITISKKLALQNLKVGDSFNLNMNIQKLAFSNQKSEIEVIEPGAWKYDLGGKDNVVDLYDIDLTKMTYDNDPSTSNNFYYYDYLSKRYEPYYNLKNVFLDLDKNKFNQELFKTVNEQYQEYANKKTYKQKTNRIYPFDILKYEDGQAIEIGQDLLLSGTNNWMNIALQNNLFTNKLVKQGSSKKLKVVAIEDLYDGDKIYLDQKYANELLGISEAIDQTQTLADGQHVNVWSNAKMSSNPMISDQLQKLILQSINGNNATAGIVKYFKTGIGFTEYVDMNKMAMQNLISAALVFATIIIPIFIVTGVITIYLITDIFIRRYKNFMNYMRIQGYTMREFHSLMLWIFTPVAVLATSLGMLTMWLFIKYTIPMALVKIKIALPLIVNPWLFVGVALVCLLIFIVAYIVIMQGVKKIKLNTLLGNS